MYLYQYIPICIPVYIYRFISSIYILYMNESITFYSDYVLKLTNYMNWNKFFFKEIDIYHEIE